MQRGYSGRLTDDNGHRRLLLVFVADLHRTRRMFIRSKSFVQLKTFCADEITVDGCSMDKAYETRMQ